MNEVFIIGGGNSVKDVDKSKLENKDLIVINKAIVDFPNPKYFITMDQSVLKKLDKGARYLRNTTATKVFIANFVPSYMEEKNGQIVDTRWNLVYKLNIFDMIIKSKNLEKLGTTFKDFGHGNNSAFCALQLAILLGYEKINLIGVDLVAEGTTHYHGGYGVSLEKFREKLDEYYQTFKTAILEFKSNNENIEIYSRSPISRLNHVLLYKEL